LKEKLAAPVWKDENTAVGIRHANHVATLSTKVGTNFAEKLLSLGLQGTMFVPGVAAVLLISVPDHR
jgi:hypothetical protein